MHAQIQQGAKTLNYSFANFSAYEQQTSLTDPYQSMSNGLFGQLSFNSPSLMLTNHLRLGIGVGVDWQKTNSTITQIILLGNAPTTTSSQSESTKLTFSTDIAYFFTKANRGFYLAFNPVYRLRTSSKDKKGLPSEDSFTALGTLGYLIPLNDNVYWNLALNDGFFKGGNSVTVSANLTNFVQQVFEQKN